MLWAGSVAQLLLLTTPLSLTVVDRSVFRHTILKFSSGYVYRWFEFCVVWSENQECRVRHRCLRSNQEELVSIRERFESLGGHREVHNEDLMKKRHLVISRKHPGEFGARNDEL
ncbi:unnamed protein product [Cuscuta epithymum]|uniref:Secreted protein n=1 Tax=Cuscuta epithymum TaxID=186058 RepID=A0AAV0DS42_9ASTE|nr:unnamed protein product [Cuscuta epithymum]